MELHETVYLMERSIEGGRPEIDLEEQQITWDDWGDLESPFPRGLEVLESPSTLRFRVERDDALDWHWYRASYWGMISQRAKDLIWPFAHGRLRAFKTLINNSPFYILRLDNELGLDCLDTKNAAVEVYPDSGRIMYVKRYAFHKDRIEDPSVFFVPEKRDLLCTESVRQAVLDAGLKGFSFRDAEQPIG
jgi:hypothetical protein